MEAVQNHEGDIAQNSMSDHRHCRGGNEPMGFVLHALSVAYNQFANILSGRVGLNGLLAIETNCGVLWTRPVDRMQLATRRFESALETKDVRGQALSQPNSLDVRSTSEVEKLMSSLIRSVNPMLVFSNLSLTHIFDPCSRPN